MKAGYLYDNIDVFFIITAILISFKKYAGKTTTLYLKLFPYFLLLTLAVEITGIIMSDVLRRSNNLWLYTNFMGIEFLFYFWVLREIIVTPVVKKIILFVIIIFTVVYYWNNLFGQGKTGFPSITYAIGCVLIALGCLFYFYELFQRPSAFSLFQQPSFWVCTGLLFYYIGTFPFFGLVNFFNIYQKFVKYNMASFIQILNIFLYSSFSIAFVCPSVFKKSSPSLLLEAS